MTNKRKNKIYIIICLITTLFSIILFYNNKPDVVSEMVITTPTPVPTVTQIPTATPTVTPTPTVAVTATPIETHTIIPVENLELCSTETPTLYTTYSEEELELLFRVVEAETTGSNVECKSNVASVIFNRLKEGWWGGDLTKNLMAKRQFEVITNGRYKRVKVTEETILGCEIAFAGDTTQGALFFDSTKGKSWAHKNCEYIFSDAVHWFYK